MAKLNIYCILMSDHLRLGEPPLSTDWSTRATAFPRYDILCLTQTVALPVAELAKPSDPGLGQYGCRPAQLPTTWEDFLFHIYESEADLRVPLFFHLYLYCSRKYFAYADDGIDDFGFHSAERLQNGM